MGDAFTDRMSGNRFTPSSVSHGPFDGDMYDMMDPDIDDGFCPCQILAGIGMTKTVFTMTGMVSS